MKVSLRRKPKFDTADYHARWIELQKHCASRKTWPQAVIEADALLAEALKKARFKGKSTGERMVAAQRSFTSNEAVWFGHKLSKKIGEEDVRRLKKQDIMDALTGFRQALRDIGALEQ